MTALDGASIEAIVFDIDGTIADTDDAFVTRLARWLRIIRWVLPDQDPLYAARWFVMRIEAPANAILGWLDRTGLDQVLGPRTNNLHHLRGNRAQTFANLIPGVKDALIRLAEHYPLAVVTAREHKSAHAILQSHALEPLFRCVATARTCRRTKPHPDPILWALSEIGISPSRCLMVGDTTPDIQAGKSAGLVTVGVLCGFGDRDELVEAGADIILETTADLADLLLGS
jgi:HAD superfamily hydrolase (TIGR01549 family)